MRFTFPAPSDRQWEDLDCALRALTLRAPTPGDAMWGLPDSTLQEAENMLFIFEGMVASCHDRGALPSDVFEAVVDRSRKVRRELKRMFTVKERDS